MTTTTADDLRTNLIGAWALQSYEARSIDGSNVTYPLGVDAKGTIIYTPDDYMALDAARANALTGTWGQTQWPMSTPAVASGPAWTVWTNWGPHVMRDSEPCACL